MNNLSYFSLHTHTHFSNLRLLDSINKPKQLIEKAMEYGLTGIAITDHECLSASIEVNNIYKEIRKTNKDFKVAIGNEIYLTETRDKSQKYFHFILIAKDSKGHRLLRELSSKAWYNSYTDRGMVRVPTLKSELKEIVSKDKGHLIATTACMGGEYSQLVLELIELESKRNRDYDKENEIKQKIVDFINFMKDLFGADFYVETAPSTDEEQIKVNRKNKQIADALGIKTVFATDAHYLTKEDRYVHKVYLNSKQGEREVDDFYKFAYLMSGEEANEVLLSYFSQEEIEELINNTNEIKDKIEFYDLKQKQIIPKVEVKNYEKIIEDTGYKFINKLLLSDDKQDRYWINTCLNKLRELNLYNDIYLDRLNTEADVIIYISEHLEQSLTSYFNTLQSYIDLFWECGSILGPGRGSGVGFLSNYLLGITQIDPVEYNLPYFRFLNKSRADDMADLDLDLAPSKRPLIFKTIREKIGETNLLMVATFGTEKTKSAILSGCRGYRSSEYPNGIDVDVAQYLTGLIPSERGFLWTIEDVIYGNEEKGRKPSMTFIEEVNNYPGLLDIIMKIEGVVNKRSSHASGVILYNETFLNTSSLMRTPSGELITAYSLHDEEEAGSIKFDFLVTEISDKIIACLDFLKQDKMIEDNLSLRELYNKYLHPQNLNLNNEKLWTALQEGKVLDVFQFNSVVGANAIRAIKPNNIFEMTNANALMRLMGQPGKETQMEKYVRYKEDINLWKNEAKSYGLTDEEIKVLSKYYDRHYGVPPFQEDLMVVLMDKDTCGFSLAESNSARKLVAKKKMDQISDFKVKIYNRAKTKQMANYLWDTLIAPSLGYSFSELHSLAYSFVGIQTLELATKFPEVYWNTACLAVNSGSLENEDNNDKTTDYGRTSKAIGEIRTRGVKVSLVDINNSNFGFKPNVENNEILFGLKGLSNVGDELVHNIIDNRPYTSLEDFLQKVKINKQAMISLVKAGAFDKLELLSREEVMKKYIWLICDKKKKLTLQNFNGLIKADLIPESLAFEKRVFNFNKYLKTRKEKEYYILEHEGAYQFYMEKFDEELLSINDKGLPIIKQSDWDYMYKKLMDAPRKWLKENQEEVLNTFNNIIYEEEYNKYATGSISKWEMDSLCFYYTKHELEDIDINKYGIEDFSSLPVEPEVAYYFKKGINKIPIFKLTKIVGTVIDKNKTKGTVVLLTRDGVVNVKMRLEYFSLFDKQISAIQEDGSKKIIEKSFFKRGSMIMVMGYRRGDSFIVKKYKNTPGHQLYKIDSIVDDKELLLRHDRKDGSMVEED